VDWMTSPTFVGVPLVIHVHTSHSQDYNSIYFYFSIIYIHFDSNRNGKWNYVHGDTRVREVDSAHKDEEFTVNLSHSLVIADIMSLPFELKFKRDES